MTNYYEKLNINVEFNAQEIREYLTEERKKWSSRKDAAAFEMQVEAKERIALIDEALEVFADDQKKRRYDKSLLKDRRPPLAEQIVVLKENRNWLLFLFAMIPVIWLLRRGHRIYGVALYIFNMGFRGSHASPDGTTPQGDAARLFMTAVFNYFACSLVKTGHLYLSAAVYLVGFLAGLWLLLVKLNVQWKSGKDRKDVPKPPHWHKSFFRKVYLLISVLVFLAALIVDPLTYPKELTGSWKRIDSYENAINNKHKILNDTSLSRYGSDHIAFSLGDTEGFKSSWYVEDDILHISAWPYYYYDYQYQISEDGSRLTLTYPGTEYYKIMERTSD